LLVFFNLWVWSHILGGRSGDLYLDFLSVGQGDSEIISLPSGPIIVVDGGPDGKVVPEVERSLKKGKYIDIMILTHPHADHYVGLAELVRRYDIGVLLLPEAKSSSPAFLDFLEYAEKTDLMVVHIGEGDRITSGEMKMDFLSPSVDDGISDMNARSIVFMFEHRGVRALFTGDIGEKQEKRMIGLYDMDADILKVPHHGSSGSSSSAFLAEVGPAVSVVEVGDGNRYGFPTVAALDRLKAAGSAIYRTDTDGTLRIVPGDKGLKILKMK